MSVAQLVFHIWYIYLYYIYIWFFAWFLRLVSHKEKSNLSKSPGTQSQISNDLNTFSCKRLPGSHGFEKAPAPSVPIESLMNANVVVTSATCNGIYTLTSGGVSQL